MYFKNAFSNCNMACSHSLQRTCLSVMRGTDSRIQVLKNIGDMM